jgi:hypothetical protein
MTTFFKKNIETIKDWIGLNPQRNVLWTILSLIIFL